MKLINEKVESDLDNNEYLIDNIQVNLLDPNF